MKTTKPTRRQPTPPRASKPSTPWRALEFSSVIWCGVLAAAPALGAPSDAEQGARSDKMPVTAGSAEVRELYEKGWLYIESWRLDDSLPIFEHLVEIEPDFVLGWVGLAWSQPRFKDMFEHADHALRLLDKVEVSEAEVLQVRAFHASINSDPESWQRYTERLVELYPRDERAVLALGGVHRGALNDREGALRQYRRAAEINPSYTAAWRAIGTMESLLGRKDEAEAAYRRFLELAPEDPRAAADLAKFLLELGDVDQALGYYHRALELSPLFEDAERGIVTVWMLRDQHEKARRHLQDIYRQAPHDGFRCGIHFALAVTYADQGKYAEAIRELESNFELSAKIGDSLAMAIDLNNMIELLLESGRLDEAQKRAEELLRHIQDDPSQPEARKRVTATIHQFRQGRIALYRGDLETAKEKAKAVHRHAEELGRPWMARFAHQLPGEIALAEERWDDAIRELMAANPDSARNMYRMALAFDGKGDREGYRRMLDYVVGYRGVLNQGYAIVRREAERRRSLL